MIEKLLTGIIVISTISIGGHEIYKITIHPATIGELLAARESVELLKAEDQKWPQLIEKYKKVTTASPAISTIDGFHLDESSTTETEERRFLKACQNLWNSDSNIAEAEKTKKEIAIKNWCIESPQALQKQ